MVVVTAGAVLLAACTSGGSTAPSSNASTVSSTSSRVPRGTAIAPAPTNATAPSYQAELSRRRLHLPTLRPGQACPASRSTAVNTPDFGGYAPGRGPVRPLAVNADGLAPLTSNTQQPGWLAIKSLWFSEPSYQGPFLVRIRRIDGAGPAGVLEDPALTSFYTPAGATINTFGGYRTVTGATWVKTPGCIAWQVDGLTFSNVIVVRAVCQQPDCVMATLPRSSPSAATRTP